MTSRREATRWRRSLRLALALACACRLAPAAALEGARYQIVLHPISAWAKVCSRDGAAKTTCYTSRHFGRDPKKPPILDLSVSATEGDAAHSARFLVPVGLRTDAGLVFSIDGGGRQPGRFEACVPNGCFAEASLDSPALAAMKKGGTMQITTTDGTGKRTDFYLSLAGFAAAYDGAGVDYRPVMPPATEVPGRPKLPRRGGTRI